MKTKDRMMYPTIEEYRQLQLQPVVSEPHPRRNVNPGPFAASVDAFEPSGDRVRKSANKLH